MDLDPRTTPLRDGVASRALEGLVRAEVYLDPKTLTCAVPAAGVHRAPDLASEQMDQILFGETFEAIEEEGGFLLGQVRRDGYVGFVPASALARPAPEPTHRVAGGAGCARRGRAAQGAGRAGGGSRRGRVP